ncbi:MAG TPA: DUF1501 domain-containing protein [Vicinamibacteria bacterium]
MTTRRLFLKRTGLAFVGLGAAPGLLVRAAAAVDGARRRRTLVVVLQRGAADALNIVVPHGERGYYDARRTIAIGEPRRSGGESVLDLDGHFGLHPALEPLLPLWKDGRLAVVHAVGSPDPTRSHFDAQDFLESGTPGRKATDDGWLNRHLQAEGASASALRAVAIAPTLPRSLQGKAPAVAMTSIREFGLRATAGPAVARGFEDMYAAAVRDTLHATGEEAFEAMEALRAVDRSTLQGGAGAGRPRGSLGEGLTQVAELLKADLGVEVAFVETSGWDHHAAEGGATGQLANRLRDFGSSLAAFYRDLGPRGDDVVVVTLTEFGRTVRENGNRGTDHGHGSVALVLGGGVRGGRVHGRWPGLGPSELYEGRDLAVTTDFRDLLGELLTRHMGASDLRAVFPGHACDPQRFPSVMCA